MSPTTQTALGLTLVLFFAPAAVRAAEPGGDVKANAAAPRFTFADGTLTIQTDRYEVRWRDGCMVAAKNLLGAPGAAGAADLTAPAAAMSVGQLPNGLGSFHGKAAEGKAQHAPWSDVSPPFAASHPPGAQTRVETQDIPGGLRLTYHGLEGEPDARLVQELTVEPATGDLVIRQEAHSPNPGVFGVSFSLLNLRPDLELVVPYFGGQRWGPDFRPDGGVFSIGYSRFWNAGFVIGQHPGATGSFIVWAEDPALGPKFLRRSLTDKALALGFEACNEAPYEQTRECKAFAWHFNTYAGDWRQPAGRYKRWMIDALQLVPRDERPGSGEWLKDIAMIYPIAPGETAALKTMAEAIDPKHVLVMDFGMLKDFNRRIPEYKPADPDYAAKVAAARALGYRAGCYTSPSLVDQETHPTVMKDYGLDYFYPGLLEDKPTAVKDWLVYVHPGSARWREFYAGKMAELHQKIGLDFLYQDVTGGSLGSAGVIEGKNWNQAVIAAESAIREKSPAVALAGEYWTEVNAAREDFGLATFTAWGDDAFKQHLTQPHQPHPVLSYLLSEYCLHWPHQVTVRDTDRFHRDQNINEVTGAIPVWETAPDDRTGEARLLLARAKLFAEGFRPHFPQGGAWEPGAVSYLRNPAGRVVQYVRPKDRGGQSTYCYELTAQDGKETQGTPKRLVYARVTGVDRVAAGVPTVIDGWIAYGPDGPLGLDPARWYSVFPADPRAPQPPLRLTALPEGAVITGTRLTDEYALVQLSAAKAGVVTFRAEGDRKPLFVATPAGRQDGGANEVRVEAGPAALLFAYRAPQPLATGEPLPLDKWRPQIVAAGQVVRPGAFGEPQPRDIEFSGQTRRAVRVLAPLGGVGSELSIDGFVTLPNSPGASLQFSTGLFGGPGDGMNFVLRVNGQEVWRQFRKSEEGGWRDLTVPLKAYAGQSVVLSFAVDCGPSGFNTSCDDAAWGDVRVIAGQ